MPVHILRSFRIIYGKALKRHLNIDPNQALPGSSFKGKILPGRSCSSRPGAIPPMAVDMAPADNHNPFMLLESKKLFHVSFFLTFVLYIYRYYKNY